MLDFLMMFMFNIPDVIMQETRQLILEILKSRGQATVDEIVADLQSRRGKITAVTVRHHLTRLQIEELVTSPQMRHRTSPGRPQHVYALTEKAAAFFPNNYQRLASVLMDVVEQQAGGEGINVIIEGIAAGMAHDACIPQGPLRERLAAVVEYLNSQGYQASWEDCGEGYVLHTRNCPYHEIARDGSRLCQMDMRLVAALLGVVPRLLSRISEGDESCSYLIPEKQPRTA